MTARWPALSAALTLLPGIAAAADFGSLSVEGKALALTSACVYSPRFDTQGWGKPEATLLLSDKPIDCPAATGWVTPENGAFEQVVRKGRGALLSISFKPGLQLGRVSVYGVGYSLGNDNCVGCVAQAAYAGIGFKGTAKTVQPIKLNDKPITFDVRFDLPKPAAPGAGEKLAGGGDPGKAEEDWGFHSDPAERKAAIQGENQAKSAKILNAWKNGKDATLIVEVAHPFNPSERTKAVIGLWFDGTGWRVREERMDFGGTMLGS